MCPPTSMIMFSLQVEHVQPFVSPQTSIILKKFRRQPYSPPYFSWGSKIIFKKYWSIALGNLYLYSTGVLKKFLRFFLNNFPKSSYFFLILLIKQFMCNYATFQKKKIQKSQLVGVWKLKQKFIENIPSKTCTINISATK